DGPLHGANVYYDTNINGVADTSEFLGKTDANGALQIQYTPVAGAKFIVLSDENTVDSFTGNKFSLTLLATDSGGASEVVSPLSTLVASSDVSEAQLKAALGLPDEVVLASYNYVDAIKGGSDGSAAGDAALAVAQKMAATSVAIGNVIESAVRTAQAAAGGNLTPAQLNDLTTQVVDSVSKVFAKLPSDTPLADATQIASELALSSVLDAGFDIDQVLSTATAQGAPLTIAAIQNDIPVEFASAIQSASEQLAQTSTELETLFATATDATSLQTLTGSGGVLDQQEDAATDAVNSAINDLADLDLQKDTAAVTEGQTPPVKGNLLANDVGLNGSEGVFSVNGTLVPDAVRGSATDPLAVGNSYVISTSDWYGTSHTVDQSAISAFVGTPGIGAAGSNATAGSAIRQTVTVDAGQTLTFDFKFGSYDYLPYNDFAFISIAEQGGSSSVSKVFNISDLKGSQPYTDAGIWKVNDAGTFSYTFTQAGTYSLGMGVTDAIDQIVDSVFTVQNIRIDGALVVTPAEVIGNVDLNAAAPITDISALFVMGDYGTLIVGKSGDYIYIPGGANADNVPEGAHVSDDFTYTVKASNGILATQILSVAVTGTAVGDVAMSDNDPSANTVAENAAIGTVVGITALGVDAGAGATVTYALTNDAGGKFAIGAQSGVVTVASALDFEAASSQTITVKATSSDGSVASSDFTIDVTNVNEPLVLSDSDPSANTVAEDAAIGTVVGVTALGVDADAGATVTYALTNDADGKFAIDAQSGVVTVAGTLDYETATSHTITVQATSSDGSEASSDFTIDVTNANDNPVVLSDSDPSANTVAENAAIGMVVGITALGVDAGAGTTVTYALTNDADGKFAIDA
ncbi:MAG: cadherin repeat domain-containing protein, partial [Ilumatobacteraceae bacterium]|nr:cadherin repeat domain-containing protein [Ilumatobacteraceae bacterium]